MGYGLWDGKWDKINESARRYYDTDGISPTIHTCNGGNTEPKIEVYENWVVGGLQEHQTPRTDGICPALTSAMGMGGGQIPIILGEDTGNTNAVEILVLNNTKHSQQRIYNTEGISPSILSGSNGGGQSPVKHLTTTKRIRKLTPREAFRLMDFPDTFDFSVVSNSQAYKQAGNSIVVAVLAAIINKLKL